MSSFKEKVFQVVAQIPRGKVATYGQIARLVGKISASRAVGNVLHTNTDTQKVPCHRVVNREGKMAKMYAFGGADAQQKRLENEGIVIKDGRVDLQIFQWTVKM